MKLFIHTFLLLFICFSCTDPSNELIITRVNLSQESVFLKVNEQSTIFIEDEFADEPNDLEISWFSTDTVIAKVDNGEITGISPGITYVYVIVNGIQSNACKVNVNGVLDEDNDVYILGNNHNDLLYWKNGISTLVKESDHRIIGRAIQVHNEDIYIAGNEYNAQGQTIAKYWVNGFETALAEGGSVAKDIVVWQNDVYVVGHQNNSQGISNATLWKNGSPTYLDDGGKFSTANSIKIYNGEIFISGYSTIYEDGLMYFQSKFWKDGQETIISKKTSAEAVDILIHENTQYTLVNEAVNGVVIPQYWTDGNSYGLTDQNAIGTSMTIMNNNLLVTGYTFENGTDNRYITLWENGLASRLSNRNIHGEVSKIVTSFSDVYILANEEHPDNNIPKYWKNGKEVFFNNIYESVFATDIEVVSK